MSGTRACLSAAMYMELLDERVIRDSVSRLSALYDYTFSIVKPATVLFESTVPTYAVAASHVFAGYLARRIANGHVELRRPDGLLVELAKRVRSRLASAALIAAAYRDALSLNGSDTVAVTHGLYTEIARRVERDGVELAYRIVLDEAGAPSLIVVIDDNCTREPGNGCSETRDALLALRRLAGTHVLRVEVYGWHDIHRPVQKAVATLLGNGFLEATRR